MLSAQSMGSVCIGAVMTKIGHRLKMLHFTSVSVDVFQEEKCVVLLSDDDAVSFAVFFGRNKGLFILVLIIKRMLVPSLNRTSPGYRLYYTQSFNHKVMVWRSFWCQKHSNGSSRKLCESMCNLAAILHLKKRQWQWFGLEICIRL